MLASSIPDSIVVGRLGGVRAINRRYICDHVPVEQLTSASAAFISASALGMAVGPAVAGLLSRIDFKVPADPFNVRRTCNYGSAGE